MSLPKSEVSEILNVMGNVIIRLVDWADNEVLFQTHERRALLNTMYEKLCGVQMQEILDEANAGHNLVLKRGDTTANDGYTGIPGEITMDTDANTVRVHDGETTGGIAMARATDTIGDWVVESQLPTAENNYTWYRKYKSGWVEQGQGLIYEKSSTVTTHNLPIEMQDANYTVTLGNNQPNSSSGGYSIGIDNITTTSFDTRGCNSGSTYGNTFSWYVCGIAA